MFWIKKKRLQKALEANGLIHDAIIMGVFDKFHKEENLEHDEFGLQLLARSLNWAIPRPDYDIQKDIEGVENPEHRASFESNQDQIHTRGLNILNSDPLLERLVAFYIAYEIHLINSLYSKGCKEKYPDLGRMSKFLIQSTEKEPGISSPDFKKDYKDLFIEFNSQYGIYGKTLKQETVDGLFSLI